MGGQPLSIGDNQFLNSDTLVESLGGDGRLPDGPAENGASGTRRASSLSDEIVVRGARVHNLKNINCTIPRNKITVVTGLSGSGKSSLAFDTLYAEGQRRYVESLSAYARQFLERMEKPDVDEISGIAPPVAIRQKNTTRNPRSTVATATEIYDYLRLLFARIGVTMCYRCGQVVQRDHVDAIADRVLALEPAHARSSTALCSTERSYRLRNSVPKSSSSM